MLKVAPVQWDSDWSLPIESLVATKPALFSRKSECSIRHARAVRQIEQLDKAFSGALYCIDEAYVEFCR